MAYRHLISISDLNNDEIMEICRRASGISQDTSFLEAKRRPPLALIFLEPSTRTRISFERAAQILGIDYTVMEAKGSSVEKGETLNDTLINLRALGFEQFVIRNPRNGDLKKLATEKIGTIINAGEGTLEHPTQALLDLTTLFKFHHGEFDNLKGLRLGIIGDLRRSRVAQSWSLLAPRFGIELILISPKELRPGEWGASFEWTEQKEKVLPKLNGIMSLRVQRERADGVLLEDETADFIEKFQISKKDLNVEQFLMHPGPVNWGVELNRDVSDLQNNLILDQVASGLAVRAVILDFLCP